MVLPERIEGAPVSITTSSNDSVVKLLAELRNLEVMTSGDEVRVSTLLRKGLSPARRAGFSELLDFIQNELDGYDAKAPQYRRLVGNLVGVDSFGGTFPLKIEGMPSHTRAEISQFPLKQSVSFLESLCDDMADMGPEAHADYDASKLLEILYDAGAYSDGDVSSIRIRVKRPQVKNVLESIRTQFLRLLLDAEDALLKQSIVADEAGTNPSVDAKLKEIAENPRKQNLVQVLSWLDKNKQWLSERVRDILLLYYTAT